MTRSHKIKTAEDIDSVKTLIKDKRIEAFGALRLRKNKLTKA